MPILFCSLELHLPYCHSLKEKRKVVSGTAEKLRSRFKCSVAEIGHQDLWQRGRIGVAVISSSRNVLDQMAEKISLEAANLLGGDLVGFSVEILEHQ